LAQRLSVDCFRADMAFVVARLRTVLCVSLFAASAHAAAPAVATRSSKQGVPTTLLHSAAAQLLPGGQFYAPSSLGNFEGEAPWQAANTLETLASLAGAVGPAVQPALYGAVRQAFDDALAATHDGFFPSGLRDYDDFGWWALAVLRFARVPPPAPAASEGSGISGNVLIGGTTALNYVGIARTVFDMFVQRAWNESQCGGGVLSGPVAGPLLSGKATITNELFLALATALFEVTGEHQFLEWANKQWGWMSMGQGKAMRDASKGGMFSEGMDLDYEWERCVGRHTSTAWTYNQGVVLGALASLFRATGDESLLRSADEIARTVMQRLATPDGVLQEPCETSGRVCGRDQLIYKGIFARYLWQLSAVAAPADAAAYRAFLMTNVASAVAHGSGGGTSFGLRWTGPFEVDMAGSATQSAAIDLLLAAAYPDRAALPPLRAQCITSAEQQQQQQQQQQQEDAVGAWARPGLRWLGETNELLYGLSLAECQQACLAKAPQECDLYTFMAENEDVGEGRSACYIYSDQNQSQTVSLDLSGCGTVSGCHYASGSRRCYVPDKHDGTFGNLII